MDRRAAALREAFARPAALVLVLALVLLLATLRGRAGLDPRVLAPASPVLATAFLAVPTARPARFLAAGLLALRRLRVAIRTTRSARRAERLIGARSRGRGRRRGRRSFRCSFRCGFRCSFPGR